VYTRFHCAHDGNSGLGGSGGGGGGVDAAACLPALRRAMAVEVDGSGLFCTVRHPGRAATGSSGGGGGGGGEDGMPGGASMESR
jgi:hypothetical protein